MRTKIGLSVASILLTVLACEVTLRLMVHRSNRGLLYALPGSERVALRSRVTLGHMIRPCPNPRIIYELQPGLQVIYEGGLVTTNARGFRGEELPDLGRQPAFRIIGLGDSYMFGQGVSDHETYMARLEHSLLAKYQARTWQVINMAVPGYNTAMEVATMSEKGIAWRPNLIVLEVVGNDFDLPNFIRVPDDPFSGRRSFLVEFVGRRWRLVRRPADSPSGLESAPVESIPGGTHFLDDPGRVPPEYRDMVGVEAWERALHDLRTIGVNRGIPIVVLTQGVSFDRRLRRLCSQLGFHYLDVGPALREYLRRGGYQDYVQSPLVIRQGDPHPSALAHEIIARELLSFLNDRNLLGDVHS